jgi:glycerol-3-phosphate dehydrogenase (NAD(P)+)
MKIAVLGAGAWGSALAIALSAHHQATLWSRDARACEALAKRRESPYLPGIALPEAIHVEPSLERAVAAADLVLVATATSGLRAVASAVGRIVASPRLLWACKGFEEGSNRLAHQVVAEALPQARETGALSGPSFAAEVARGLPAALVLASDNVAFAESMVSGLNTARLRLYSSSDLVGVELGGAVKNVIAIAAGISDGLELGRNARAALVTRGLAEIVRLGVAMGGHAETFTGLAGLGDLVLTCTGDLSRNRDVGLRLARGRRLEQILEELGHVAEGVHSAKATSEYARRHGIEMPIASAVCAVLFEGLEPRVAVDRLLRRDPRSEQE